MQLSFVLAAVLSIAHAPAATNGIGDTPARRFHAAGSGSGCAPLTADSIPLNYGVSFLTSIQPRLDALCGSCHVSASTSGLNIGVANARLSLIGPDERGAPFTLINEIFRVRPGKPLESGLFLKLNCEIPPDPYGARMPPGGSDLEFQALVHDWIAAGALMPDAVYGGDRLFISDFETMVRTTPTW